MNKNDFKNQYTCLKKLSRGLIKWVNDFREEYWFKKYIFFENFIYLHRRRFVMTLSRPHLSR